MIECANAKIDTKSWTPWGLTSWWDEAYQEYESAQNGAYLVDKSHQSSARETPFTYNVHKYNIKWTKKVDK